MLKKIITRVLLVSVAGAGGAAIANQAATPEEISIPPSPIIASPVQGYQQQVGDELITQGNVREPGVIAQDNTGQPWQAAGTITGLDSYGLNLTVANGETIYVELGPPDYWQSQKTKLQLGLQVTINGTENAGMYHASQVMLADGQILQLREELGQPLWSGGVDNGQGQNADSGDGDRIPDPQAQIDEWVTLSGTLMAFQGGRMTISTPEGELLSFQTGQPRFFAEQGVTFQVGDEVIVVGAYIGNEFVIGDITQVETGLRVMLRDPNGRPLWGGPGNGNGNGNGNGQGGQ